QSSDEEARGQARNEDKGQVRAAHEDEARRTRQDTEARRQEAALINDRPRFPTTRDKLNNLRSDRHVCPPAGQQVEQVEIGPTSSVRRLDNKLNKLRSDRRVRGARGRRGRRAGRVRGGCRRGRSRTSCPGRGCGRRRGPSWR